MRKIVVGVTGASGMPLAFALMRLLATQPGIQTGCIVSASARRVLERETDEDEGLLWALAKFAWKPDDLAAPPASGSWWKKDDAMIVAPCSMSTIGAIASGYAENLIHRACDVALKEKRRLVLIPRESPLSLVHLENMKTLALAGATIMPFSPGFYFRPQSLEDLLTHFCFRVFDQIDLNHSGPSWGSA